MGISVPVLLYHHVNPSREITPDGFQGQMEFLYKQGYVSLFLDELLEFFQSGKIKHKKSMVITFDDGYLDNWLFAYPILKKYNFKATIFVVTSKIRDEDIKESFNPDLDLHKERSPENFITWKQAQIMHQSGLISIESHTHYHYKTGESWECRNNISLKEELLLSKSIIETKLNKKCVFVCWPWGNYDSQSIRLARESGFQGAVTTEVGSNGFGGPAMAIKRFKVWREDLRWFRKRMSIYCSPFLAKSYASFYGFERKIKKICR